MRCEHDAVMLGVSGEKQYINIKTLNEWDPRVSVPYRTIKKVNSGHLQLNCSGPLY